jgi:N-acetylmuramoyl-L-alanine amidase
MRARILIPLATLTMLVAPASASAYFVHTITAGESLSSIAATDGLSVTQLAAANGLTPNAYLIKGGTIQIPPQSVGTSGLSSTAGAGSAIAGAGSSTSSAVPVNMSSSSGSGSYRVVPGDTLTAIAARAGTTPAALAAANGLSLNGILLAGSVIRVSGLSSGSSTSGTAEPVSTSTSSSSGSSSYLVVPGDTLTAIAARAGTTPAALAAANGLNPDGILPAGRVIRVSSTRAPATPVSASASSQPVGTVAQGNPTDPPFPTPERLSAAQIGSVASANGVPASLADAIAWQESGFNNDLVSSADARGIMQILPGTWDWIQNHLNPGPPLAPASAADNVRGGVLLLRSLLNSTGGDTSTAAAGYYQGLPSVQAHGLYSDTQQYVRSVTALEQQFGGG